MNMRSWLKSFWRRAASARRRTEASVPSPVRQRLTNAAAVVGLLGLALAVAAGCPSQPKPAGAPTSSSISGTSSHPTTTDHSPTPAATAELPAAAPQEPARFPTTPDAAPVGQPPSPSQSQAAALPRTTAPPAVAQPASAGPSAPVAPVSGHATPETNSVGAPPSAKATPDALFADWPNPQYVLFVTGRQYGYIEPCGCSGLANQKGGLARRHTCMEQLRAKGWPVLAVDSGNQVRRYGRQSEIKFQITAEALKKMNYEAVGFGPEDLRLSSGELIAVVSDAAGKPGPFVCANANLFGLTKTHVVVERGGQRIGVTSVLGQDQLKEVQSDEIEKTSPEAGLQKAAVQLEAAGCDLQVLLANTGYDEAKTLAQKFPQFKIVVAAVGAGEPTPTPEKVGESLLIMVGEKSMYAGVLGVYADEQNPFRFQRVPLDAQFSDSPFMLTLLSTYQDTLQAEGLEGLGLRPVQHPSGQEYVGSAKCGECHTKALAVWQNTPHSHALETLVHPPERSKISRHHDPECLACHVTGWDPQGLFPYKTGYADLDKSLLLHGNGCENCHGPGSKHAAAESGDLNVDEAALAQLREEMRLPLNRAEKRCMECHDPDNDPEFSHDGVFAEKWERVKHPGKD